MGLELLTQADYVLNNCGRPVPPPGFKFVDLPRIIPFHHTPLGTTTADGYCYGSGKRRSVYSRARFPACNSR